MMATAHARLMTAVDLTLTAPPEDPAAPIVHQVRGGLMERRTCSRCGRTLTSISR